MPDHSHRGIAISRHGRRWRFFWTPARAYVTRDSVEEAISELERLVAQRERDRSAARRESVSIEYLVDDWWKRKRRELRESTRMRYEGVVRLHILPRLGHVAANDLRPVDVEDYYARLTHKTALVSRDVLRPAFRWGMANRIVHRSDGCNPLDLAKLTRAGCADGDPEADANRTMQVDEKLVPRPEEIEKLLVDAEQREDWTWWLYLRLAPSLGARPGEICALRRQDLDDKEFTFEIRRGANKHTFKVTAVKRTSSVRTLYLGPSLFADIMPIVGQLEPDGFLFPAVGTRCGERRIDCWTANGALTRLGKACERVGIPRYTPHAFRHFCATHLLDQGYPPMQVARWLGHKNDTMVRMLYAAHIVEDTRLQLGEAAARLVRGPA